MKALKRTFALLMAAAIAAVIFPTVVFADTDGSEIQITDQPDVLILQLGPEWAGVEFELKTDAGVFPAPVVVDSTGVLKMDLGGSKTYTLSCVASDVAAPGPEQSETTPSPSPVPTEPSGDSETDPDQSKDGIPTGILVVFLVGLAAAVGGLIAMRYFKRRRESYYYDEDEDDYE